MTTRGNDTGENHGKDELPFVAGESLVMLALSMILSHEEYQYIERISVNNRARGEWLASVLHERGQQVKALNNLYKES
jgi:hypothetical protein